MYPSLENSTTGNAILHKKRLIFNSDEYLGKSKRIGSVAIIILDRCSHTKIWHYFYFVNIRTIFEVCNRAHQERCIRNVTSGATGAFRCLNPISTRGGGQILPNIVEVVPKLSLWLCLCVCCPQDVHSEQYSVLTHWFKSKIRNVLEYKFKPQIPRLFFH